MKKYYKWTKDMERDLSMLFPYLTTWKVVKVLNKKHNIKLRSNCVTQKSYKMNLNKETPDGMTLKDVYSYFEEKNKERVIWLIKKEKIKTYKIGRKIYMSFSDFNYLKNKYTIKEQNKTTMSEICKISGYSETHTRRIIREYNVHSFVKCENKRRIIVINKEQLKNAIESNLNGIKFCYLNNFREKDENAEEYYSVTQVSKMLGVSRKCLNERCGGDVSTVHPDIEYVKGKGGCVKTAQIPMRAIEAIFDKLNEGWSYKDC